MCVTRVWWWQEGRVWEAVGVGRGETQPQDLIETGGVRTVGRRWDGGGRG
jgi:hypothetical protein